MKQYKIATLGDLYRSPCGRYVFQVAEIFDDGALAGWIYRLPDLRFHIGEFEHTPEELFFLGFRPLLPAATVH